MLTPVGPRFGAGQIGELYESLGGQVTWVGKPYPDMYRFAFRRIGDPAARIVAVGDSIEHDIAGGKAAGIATAFIRGGILAEADDAELAALFARYGAVPDYYAAALHLALSRASAISTKPAPPRPSVT